MRVLLTFMFVVLWWSTPAMSASFNCLRAGEQVEKLVCNDSTLSRLDDRMGILYRQAMRISNDKGKLTEAQKFWVKSIRGSCENSDCLQRVYEERNSQLFAEIEKSKSLDITKYIGHFRKPHATSCFQPGQSGEDVLSSCETGDDLFIEAKTNGSFEISLEVIGANFHECAASGTAIRKGNMLEHHFEDCVLLLQLDPDGVLLVDQNDRNCFCGMRASLHDIKFYLTEKTGSTKRENQ